MRISILLIALTGILAFSPANAGPGKGVQAQNVAACNVLKGTTRGLHGLCVAYCAHRDLSQVDLNDSASIKAASPSISILRKYNERRRPADPAMPCFKNTEPPTEPPDDPPDDPLPASNCPCWTAEELAAIDGNLIPSANQSSAVQCTTKSDSATHTSEQAVEGYMLVFEPSQEGLAFAVVDDDQFEPYYSCQYTRKAGTDPDETLEPQVILFSIERADAVACQAEIVTHCAVVDP